MRIDPKSLTIPVRIDDSAQKRELPPNRNQESSPRTTRIRNPGTSQRRHTTGISRIEGRHRDPHHRLRRSSKSRAQNPSQTPQFAAIMQDPPRNSARKSDTCTRARARNKEKKREGTTASAPKQETNSGFGGWVASPARCAPAGSSRPSPRAAGCWRPAPRRPSTAPRTARPSPRHRHRRRLLLPPDLHEQSFRHKPTQPALTPSPKHPHQLHEHTRTHSPPHPPPPTTAAIGSHMHFPDPNLPAAGRNPSRIPPSPERSVPVCGRLGWRLEREGEEGGRRRGERGGFK